MKITIEGEPKEIAEFLRETELSKNVLKEIFNGSKKLLDFTPKSDATDKRRNLQLFFLNNRVFFKVEHSSRISAIELNLEKFKYKERSKFNE